MKKKIQKYKRHIIAGLIGALVLAVILTLGPQSVDKENMRASAQVETTYTIIDTGGECSTIGTWDATTKTCTLSRDLVNENITIYTTGVTLDCANHSITGNGTDYGIYLSRTTGANVQNCSVYNFDNGILLNYANSSTITSNTTENNLSNGILLFHAGDNTLSSNISKSNGQNGISVSDGSTFNDISGNTTNSNYAGIYISSADLNTVENNTVYYNTNHGVHINGSVETHILGNNINQNHNGIVLFGSTVTQVHTNTVRDNDTYGISVTSGAGTNVIYNNIFDNNASGNADVDGTANSWNTSPSAGGPANIIGGEFMAGNYWGDYSGSDTDSDGLGDTPYIIDTANQDNYPLVEEALPFEFSFEVNVEETEENVYTFTTSEEEGTVNTEDLTFTVSPETTMEMEFSVSEDEVTTRVQEGEVLIHDEANNTVVELDAAGEGVVTQTDPNSLSKVWGALTICVTEPANMLYWWDGDNNFAGTAYDLKGNSNGILENGVTSSPGKVGNAFDFDGVDDYMRVYLGSISNQITVDAWVNPDAFTGDDQYNDYIIASQNGEVSWQIQLDPGPYGIGFTNVIVEYDDNSTGVHKQVLAGCVPAVGDGCGAFINQQYPAILAEEWHHLAVVLDTQTENIKVYIDGVEFPVTAEQYLTHVPGGMLPELHVGKGYTFDYDEMHWRGMLDEIEIFNRILTPTEIQTIYNSGSFGKCKPEVSGIAVTFVDDVLATIGRASLTGGESATVGITPEGAHEVSTTTGLSRAVSMLGPEGEEITNIYLDGTETESDEIRISRDIDGRSLITVDDTGGDDEWVDLDYSVTADDGVRHSVGRSSATADTSVAVRSTHSSPGIEIERLSGPMNLTTDAYGAVANVVFNEIGSKLRLVKGLGEDLLVLPLANSIDVSCDSGETEENMCFAGRTEHTVDGVTALVPANIQLIDALGSTTTITDGLTESVAFASAVLDGITQSEMANFLALTTSGTSVEGNGLENIVCGSTLLENNVVNVLARIVTGGQQTCPIEDGVTEENYVELHIIDQAKTGVCGGAGSCKVPIAGADIRVFDRNNTDFQAEFTKNPKGGEYDDVYEADLGRVAACSTDTNGYCMVTEPEAGEYLVVVKYFDSETGSTVYTGSPKGPEDFVDGNAVKDFQIIKVLKKNGTIQFSGGKKTVVQGSQLDIIYPLDAIWDEGTQDYVYPFIFVSDEDWEVDVCGRVPTGYEIVGVYDEEGNLVSSQDCYETFVAGETKVVAFEVVMVGSPPEWAMNVKLKVKHNGKLKHVEVGIPTHVWEHAQGKPFQDGEFTPPGHN